METTYTMIGVDGLQYGPITLEQLKSWVAEGRVTGDTKILRSDTNSWLPAANYGELNLPQAVPQTVAAPAPIAPTAANVGFDPALVRQFHSGARWFYWIAGLSLVNTFMAMSGAGIVFLFGLGITQVISNFVINVAIAGFFALLGFFAIKGHSWSFIVGMIFYAGDALIYLISSSWLGLAFHVWVLFRLFIGLKAIMQLKSSAR